MNYQNTDFKWHLTEDGLKPEYMGYDENIQRQAQTDKKEPKDKVSK